MNTVQTIDQRSQLKDMDRQLSPLKEESAVFTAPFRSNEKKH